MSANPDFGAFVREAARAHSASGGSFGFPSNPNAPPNPPGSGKTRCDATRVVQAGGALASLIQHPAFTPFERLYRKLPEEGMFTATPQQNFLFEFGAFAVPDQMKLVVVDYRFDVYRLSGAFAGDAVPIEERRLAMSLSYDVAVSDYRKGNLMMEVDPTPVAATKEAYAPIATAGSIPQSSAVQQSSSSLDGLAMLPTISSGVFGPTLAQPFAFSNATANSAQSPGGVGLSALPQRTTRQGALDMPFNIIVNASQRVSFRGICFREITMPIAFMECDVTGFLIPANFLDDLLAGMNPCVSPGGGR